MTTQGHGASPRVRWSSSMPRAHAVHGTLTPARRAMPSAASLSINARCALPRCSNERRFSGSRSRALTSSSLPRSVPDSATHSPDDCAICSSAPTHASPVGPKGVTMLSAPRLSATKGSFGSRISVTRVPSLSIRRAIASPASKGSSTMTCGEAIATVVAVASEGRAVGRFVWPAAHASPSRAACSGRASGRCARR